MHKFPKLKPGDSVEIIAPASRCTDKRLEELQALFHSWQLDCIIDKEIFGDDMLCANSDEIRYSLLEKAFKRPETKAIICARGGYGSMRLIPALAKMAPPEMFKWFVGMSDVTALSLYLLQQWQWPVIHGGASPDKFSKASIAALKAMLFGDISQVAFHGMPLNALAKKEKTLHASITGGNLCLIQTSIGTLWQMEAQQKIVFLEEIGERGYKVDRMLEHLKQANLLKDIAAIIVGDFIEGDEPNGTSLITPVLERFAERCPVPVVKIAGIGHGNINFPLPLGLPSRLKLGPHVELTIPLSFA